MKAIKIFILTCFSVLAFSFTVHAQYLPPVNPDVSAIPSFLETVGQMQLVRDSSVYAPPSDLNRLNQLVNGRTIEQSMRQVYVDNGNIEGVENWQPFYDSEGNVVSPANTYTAFGDSDIARYSFVASKATGETLYTYNSTTNTYDSTLCSGDIPFDDSFTLLLTQPNQNGWRGIAQRVAQAENMVVYGNNLTNADKDFLGSYEFSCTFTSDELGFTCYVPNCCSSNTVCVQENFGNEFHGTFGQGSAYAYANIRVFTNNPSEVYFSGTGKWGYLVPSNVNAYGKTFTYENYTGAWYAPFYYGGTVDMHLPTQAEYEQYNSLANQAVYLQPVENHGDDTNIYNYSYVTNNYVTPTSVLNPDYNPNSSTNYDNYPVTYNVTYPTYEDTNNYYETIYNIYNTPQTGDSIGTVDPSDLTDNIPILSNLQKRFPFSIPWDLKNLIQGMSVTREAPNFHWEIYLPMVDYTWVIDFDLSVWNGQAAIFRNCFLILFIISLATFAYRHYFGS